ncbi:host-nuclease inhibitor Gam family protein [Ferviditalea candida]|uniref:Host-nuclease inhibitor Gam family protein n=1 Tax=Ferviditalea candida TaxID=3108399 RepID=A0ABU5ZN00_9BACL|nr:host-nuclease inhibitor Gam family protein [Paenibacillaceae bacterium T2]
MNALLAEEFDEINEATESKFQITDLSSLNWALRKMAALQTKKNEVNQLADEEVERIEAYRKRELDTLQRSEEFFKHLIGEYAMKRREEEPGYKGDKTPYGRVGFRKSQPKWHYEDDKLIQFLEANDRADLIRIKKEPIKTEIKKIFQVTNDGDVYDENGQHVEGITVEFMPDTLDVKVE